MTYEKVKTILKECGQEQLLEYYEELSDVEKQDLLGEIANTDFSIIENVGVAEKKERGKITPITDAVSVEESVRRFSDFEKAGLELLFRGKAGAVLLAGGQGSRLGFEGPKGTFNMGLTRELSIFELQMANIKDTAARCGRPFPLFIMTSRANNADTVKFFKEHGFFGYPQDKIFFFIQNLAPACDFNGKVFLEDKGKLALTPNGNGGWYSSLLSSGCGEVIKKEGLEWLNVYSVDNVLQKICDPSFIGATLMSGCKCGSKVVKKISPEEKVGVLCLEDGKPAVVEYYELADELKYAEKDGELVYGYGVILNYLFNVDKLNEIVADKLPYHLAKKAVAHIENGKKTVPKEPCGYKFETLVVDMVRLMGGCLAYEVVREREFAPVKNATGTDSVESARVLLKLNGVGL